MLTISQVRAYQPNTILNDEIQGVIKEAYPANQKPGKRPYYIQNFLVADDNNAMMVSVFSSDHADPNFVKGKLMTIKPGEDQNSRPKITEYNGKQKLTVGFGNTLEIADIPTMGTTPDSDYVPTGNPQAATPPPQAAATPPPPPSTPAPAPQSGNDVDQAIAVWEHLHNRLTSQGATPDNITMLAAGILNRRQGWK